MLKLLLHEHVVDLLKRRLRKFDKRGRKMPYCMNPRENQYHVTTKPMEKNFLIDQKLAPFLANCRPAFRQKAVRDKNHAHEIEAVNSCGTSS